MGRFTYINSVSVTSPSACLLNLLSCSSLLSALSTLSAFQVGKLNAKDSSYSLKDELYRHVQRDWPGYLEEEKQLIHRLLIR